MVFVYLGNIWLVFVSFLGGICVWVVWFRSAWLQCSASIPLCQKINCLLNTNYRNQVKPYHPYTNTTQITYKYQPNVTQIHKYHLNKVLIHDPNGPKKAKKIQNGQQWQKIGPTMALNSPIFPQNGLQCLAKCSKLGKEYKYQIIWT